MHAYIIYIYKRISNDKPRPPPILNDASPALTLSSQRLCQLPLRQLAASAASSSSSWCGQWNEHRRVRTKSECYHMLLIFSNTYSQFHTGYLPCCQKKKETWQDSTNPWTRQTLGWSHHLTEIVYTNRYQRVVFRESILCQANMANSMNVINPQLLISPMMLNDFPSFFHQFYMTI